MTSSNIPKWVALALDEFVAKTKGWEVTFPFNKAGARASDYSLVHLRADCPWDNEHQAAFIEATLKASKNGYPQITWLTNHYRINSYEDLQGVQRVFSEALEFERLVFEASLENNPKRENKED
jgi:hypothetical protein